MNSNKRENIAIGCFAVGIMLIVVVVLLIALWPSGSALHTEASRTFDNSPRKITVYSGGVAVRVFHTTERVFSEGHGDGWYFVDRETHKPVQVGGTVIVEEE